MTLTDLILNAQAAYRSMDDPAMCEADFIADFISADVEPVRHGLWTEAEDEYGSYVRCSVCGDEFTAWEGDCAHTRFCPGCGALMDGGADNGECSC